MSVELFGLDIVSERFADLKKNLKTKAMERLATEIETDVIKRVDAHTRPGGSGQLLKSVHSQKVGKDEYEVGHDLQQAHYAPFVHWGTRPHRIDAVNRKALRWMTGTGLGTKAVFAKFVLKHPGYKGDPWLVKATSNLESTMNRIAKELNK